MRLIDADKLKQSVTNEMIKAELNSPLYCTLECVIADIEGQSTAYDVDKVGDRLEDYLFEKYCVEGDTKIDEILKSGGID